MAADDDSYTCIVGAFRPIRRDRCGETFGPVVIKFTGGHHDAAIYHALRHKRVDDRIRNTAAMLAQTFAHIPSPALPHLS